MTHYSSNLHSQRLVDCSRDVCQRMKTNESMIRHLSSSNLISKLCVKKLLVVLCRMLCSFRAVCPFKDDRTLQSLLIWAPLWEFLNYSLVFKSTRQRSNVWEASTRGPFHSVVPKTHEVGDSDCCLLLKELCIERPIYEFHRHLLPYQWTPDKHASHPLTFKSSHHLPLTHPPAPISSTPPSNLEAHKSLPPYLPKYLEFLHISSTKQVE